MEEILESLVGFTEGFTFADLNDDAILQTKRRLIDGVGCMLGGMSTPPGVASRKRASQVPAGEIASTVAGLNGKTSLEMAAFANTVMLRYWDINDSGRAGGHLSELLPGVLAAADATGSDGPTVLMASALAYELQAALGPNLGHAAESGWDYATFFTVTTALTAGKLLGLTRDELRDAAAIAAISSISTWNSRRGVLSMWMSCGSASANKNAMFSALIARDGMTGPEVPFVGDAGIMQMVTKKKFTLDDLKLPYKKELAIQQSAFKFFPCQDSEQGPVELMLQMRNRLKVDEIASIRLDSFHAGFTYDGERGEGPQDPSRWDPQNRETADHSAPFLIAAALVDGTLNFDSYKEERIKDPALRPVMELVTMHRNKEFEDLAPEQRNTMLTVTLKSGEVIQERTMYPFGHPKNPPTDERLNEKFDYLSSKSTDDASRVRAIRDTIWNLDSEKDLGEFFANFGQLKAKD